MTKSGFQLSTVNPQNKNDRTMMSGYRRVAVVEDFTEILSQIHNKDCLHAGMKKTFARVRNLFLATVKRKFVSSGAKHLCVYSTECCGGVCEVVPHLPPS